MLVWCVFASTYACIIVCLERVIWFKGILQLTFLQGCTYPLLNSDAFLFWTSKGDIRCWFSVSTPLINFTISLFSDWSMICTHHIIDQSENVGRKFKSGSVRPCKKVFIRCLWSSLVIGKMIAWNSKFLHHLPIFKKDPKECESL